VYELGRAARTGAPHRFRPRPSPRGASALMAECRQAVFDQLDTQMRR